MKREERMVELRKEGWSYQRIARRFRVSRQRVYAIVLRELDPSRYEATSLKAMRRYVRNSRKTL